MVAEFLQTGFDQLILWGSSQQMLAQESTSAPTLPEPVRQIAYMALLGIALLGMLMIVATLVGGHWVRRWGDRLRRPAVPPDVIISQPPRIDRNGGLSDDSDDDHNQDHDDNHRGSGITRL